MIIKKKKALTGAQRVSNAHDKKIDSGLRLIKIYVADERGFDIGLGYITEADRVKKYAAKQPLTKEIRSC